MLSELTGGANRALKAAGLTASRPPTKERNVTHRHAIAGALTLNIPTLVAAAYLPAAAAATMAVCLAVLGAVLGTLVVIFLRDVLIEFGPWRYLIIGGLMLAVVLLGWAAYVGLVRR